MERGFRSSAVSARLAMRSADQIGQASLLLLSLAVVLALAAALLQNQALAALLWLAGIVLLLCGGSAFAFARLALLRQRRSVQLIETLCQDDPSDCFITDAAGMTLHLNPAARERMRGSSDGAVICLLSGRFAAPVDVFRRLLAEAEAQGSARQEVDLRRMRNQISVTRVAWNRFLWRIDELVLRGAAGHSVATMGLPMLIASHEGSIHYANPALKALIGVGRTHLTQILPDLPVRPGKIHRLETVNGICRVRTAEYSGPTGRREIYLFPDDTVDDATDWSMADDFPVPMLKLSARGRVLIANARARDLLGPGASEGRELSDLVEGLGRSVAEWLTEAETGAALRRPEVLRVNRHDRELFLQIRLSRLDQPGTAAFVAVLTDLTEMKQLESQFVQSQKMQAIGQLAGGVAHDFNNLLTAISGHCDLLLLRHDPDDPDHGDLQQIAQNTNRAAALVGQLLAYSRKQNLQPQVLDLRQILADHAHLLKRLMGERVVLNYSAPDDLPLVRADRRQIEQVVMNLVVNARDAMPNGGEIRVILRAEALTAPLSISRTSIPEGQWLVIVVQDQGPGIPEDLQQKIFEPFYTTKRAGEGTGLGLSTAYGIVKQSGGYIFARSLPTLGAEMQVWLPALPPGTAACEEQQRAPQHRRRTETPIGVILLVEDEEPVRAFAARALRLHGHTVIEASGAEHALEILSDAQMHVDVIVSDVIMPGMDGPTWAQIARENRPEIGVVFISGYAEDSIADHSARISGASFLGKPFSLNQLAEAVAKQLA